MLYKNVEYVVHELLLLAMKSDLVFKDEGVFINIVSGMKIDVIEEKCIKKCVTNGGFKLFKDALKTNMEPKRFDSKLKSVVSSCFQKYETDEIEYVSEVFSRLYSSGLKIMNPDMFKGDNNGISDSCDNVNKSAEISRKVKKTSRNAATTLRIICIVIVIILVLAVVGTVISGVVWVVRQIGYGVKNIGSCSDKGFLYFISGNL